jgi:hypothetical protein
MQRPGTRHGGNVWRKEKVRGQGFPKACRPPQLRTMGVLLLERDRVWWIDNLPQWRERTSMFAIPVPLGSPSTSQ